VSKVEVKQTRHRASISEVALAAGVSSATVSRVLNGMPSRASETTRQRVLAAAEKLQYRPNAAGRSLRTQRMEVIGLLISNIQNSFYAAIAHEIEKQINAMGGLMLLCNTDENAELQDKYLAELEAMNASGILVLCAIDSERFRRFSSANNVVLINRALPSKSELSFVGIDDYRAARDLAAAMLRTPGDGHIGIIHGPLYSHTSSERLRGLNDVFEQNEVRIQTEHITASSLTMEGGYQGAHTLLNTGAKFKAIFCGSDQIAYGAYRRCREYGIEIGPELRLFGFDDNPLNVWLAPWLNTVRVPYQAIANESILQLKRLWAGEGPLTKLLPYELVQRN